MQSPYLSYAVGRWTADQLNSHRQREQWISIVRSSNTFLEVLDTEDRRSLRRSLSAPPHLLTAEYGSEQQETCTFPTAVKNHLASQMLWSIGSPLHMERKCKPCHYVASRGGCRNSIDCQFCHLPHIVSSESGSSRPSKLRRARARLMASSLEPMLGDSTHATEFRDAAEALAFGSPYLRRLLGKFS